MLFNGRWIFQLKAIHLKLLYRAMLFEALKSQLNPTWYNRIFYIEVGLDFRLQLMPQESRAVLAIRDEETHWY